MARSRNIKPGLYQNEELACCSFAARYLFPGLWMLADREGRLEDRPMRIKGQLLPYDALSVDAVESLLNELDEHGLILRYEKSEKQYIQVVNFQKHQTPHCKETQSTIPAPDKHQTSTRREQVLHPLIPDSLNPMPDTLIPDSLKEKKERVVVGLDTPSSAGEGDWVLVIALWNKSSSPVKVAEPFIRFTSSLDRHNADRFAGWWKEDGLGWDWEQRAGVFLAEAMQRPSIYGKPLQQVNFGYFMRDEVWKSVLQLQAVDDEDDGLGGLPLIT